MSNTGDITTHNYDLNCPICAPNEIDKRVILYCKNTDTYYYDCWCVRSISHEIVAYNILKYPNIETKNLINNSMVDHQFGVNTCIIHFCG